MCGESARAIYLADMAQSRGADKKLRPTNALVGDAAVVTAAVAAADAADDAAAGAVVEIDAADALSASRKSNP